jgi:hypothetical protein
MCLASAHYSRRVLAGDLDQHREAGIALDQGGNLRVIGSGDAVPAKPDLSATNEQAV